MTSQAYSNNAADTGLTGRKNNRFYPFVSAFGVGPVALAAGVLLFCLFTGALSPGVMRRIALDSPELLYYMNPAGHIGIFYFLIAAQSVLTAVVLFAFTANRRASGAYFGLPVKRSVLFISRYAAGLICLLAPQAVIFALLLFANLAVFGSTAAVWSGWAVIFGTVLAFMFAMYGITALVCLHVGSLADGIAFTVIVLYVLPFLPILSQPLFSMLLHGSAMGELYNRSLVAANKAGAAVGRFWLPISSTTFLQDYCAPSSSNQLLKFLLLGDGYNIPLITLPIWFLGFIGVSALAYRAFIRYKAERSGMLGVNTAFNAVCISAVTLCAFCISLDGAANEGAGNYINKLLFACLISLAVFTVCRFLLTLNLRAALSGGFGLYLADMGIAAAVALCCVTGGFGYSGRQPNPGDIASAHITYTGAPDFIPGPGETFGNYYSRSDGDPDIFVREYTSLNYSAPEDIEKILALHRELIDAGPELFGSGDRIKLQVVVSYELNDGKKTARFYRSIPADMAHALLMLDETQYISELAGGATGVAREYYASNPEESKLYVSDYLFGRAAELSPEDIPAFLTALQQDIDSLSFDEKYYADTPARAVVSLPRHYRDREGVLREPNMNYANTYINSSVVISNAFFSENADTDGGDYFNYLLAGPSTDTLRFYLTGGWENTLSFLRGRNLCAWLDDEPDISTITAIRAEKYPPVPAYETQALYFRSYVQNMGNPAPAGVDSDIVVIGGRAENKNSAAAKAVPEDKYEELLSRARTHYYMDGGGYLLSVDINDGSGERRLTLFLPEADAPEYVR